jgi:SAM-dependent methyltransferase
MTEKPDYGNWVHRGAFYLLIMGAALTLGASMIPALPFIIKLMLRTASVGHFAFFLYLLYVYYIFSESGGNLQQKTYDYVAGRLPWDGRGVCLDIGAGNAPLAIKVAKRFPGADVVASDFWNMTKFDYKPDIAARNAAIEGVAGRVSFKHASAAELPFRDGEFDAVVSNYVFHEVRAFKHGEKHRSFIEALRVLKKGGAFSIHDVFTNSWFYGDFEKLKKTLREHVSDLHWEDSRDKIGIPFLLRNRIVQGKIGLFYGKK